MQQPLLLLLLLRQLVPTTAVANYLWRIDSSNTDQPPSYLFGTKHVHFEQVWDVIPETAKKAFETSDSFYGEVDLTNQDEIKRLLECEGLVYKNQDLTTLHPILDVFLAKMAQEMGKKQRGGLEEQTSGCETQLATREADEMLQKRIARFGMTGITEISEEESLEQYRSGNVGIIHEGMFHVDEAVASNKAKKAVAKHWTDTMKLEEKRGEKMTKKIMELLMTNNDKSHFFAVGVDLLLGSHNNIVKRLREEGFKVERVEQQPDQIVKTEL